MADDIDTIDLLDPNRAALTPLQRKRLQRRAQEQPRGHAWSPGSGPTGETCGTCEHRCRINVGAKTISKCGKVRDKWTSSVRTDIRAKDAACKFWEACDD